MFSLKELLVGVCVCVIVCEQRHGVYMLLSTDKNNTSTMNNTHVVHH